MVYAVTISREKKNDHICIRFDHKIMPLIQAKSG